MYEINNVEVFGWENMIREAKRAYNSDTPSDSEFTDGKFTLGEFDRIILDKNIGLVEEIKVCFDLKTSNKEFNDVKAYFTKYERDLKLGADVDDPISKQNFDWKDSMFGEDEISLLSIVSKFYIDRYKETNQKQYYWKFLDIIDRNGSYKTKYYIYTNYQSLKEVYERFKNTDDKKDLVNFIEGLPYSELIVGKRI